MHGFQYYHYIHFSKGKKNKKSGTLNASSYPFENTMLKQYIIKPKA